MPPKTMRFLAASSMALAAGLLGTSPVSAQDVLSDFHDDMVIAQSGGAGAGGGTSGSGSIGSGGTSSSPAPGSGTGTGSGVLPNDSATVPGSGTRSPGIDRGPAAPGLSDSPTLGSPSGTDTLRGLDPAPPPGSDRNDPGSGNSPLDVSPQCATLPSALERRNCALRGQ